MVEGGVRRAAGHPARRASCDVAHPVRVLIRRSRPAHALRASGAVARLLDYLRRSPPSASGRGCRRGYQRLPGTLVPNGVVPGPGVLALSN